MTPANSNFYQRSVQFAKHDAASAITKKAKPKMFRGRATIIRWSCDLPPYLQELIDELNKVKRASHTMKILTGRRMARDAG